MNHLKIITAMTDDHVAQLMTLYRAEWWSGQRTLEDVRIMLANSTFVFAVTDWEEKILHGFARVLSDHVYRGTIFDVIVAENSRDQGIGKFIMTTIKNHPVLQKIHCLELYCREEHIPFYEKQGFQLSGGRKGTKRMSIER